MLTSVLVAVAMAATPSWSIVITRRVGVEPAKAVELAEQLSRALSAVPGAPLGTLVPAKDVSVLGCAGSSACVANVGKSLGVERIVALQLIKLGADITVDATLIDSSGSVPLAAVTAQVSASSPGKKLEEIAAQLAAKAPAAPVAEVIPPAPPLAADAPKVTPPLVLENVPPPPPPLVETASPAKPLRYVSYAMGAGAVIAGGIGAGLGVSALMQANATKNTDADFLQRHNAAVATGRGADVCYGVAAALAVGAIVTFIVSRD